MPFLRPDVIKLDLRLIQDRPSEPVAETHNAVQRPRRAHRRAGGGRGHRDRGARRAGPRHGRHRRPGLAVRPPRSAARERSPSRRSRIPIFEPHAPRPPRPPFRSIEGRRPLRRGTKRLLLEISRELERQAEPLGEQRGPDQHLPARPPLHPAPRPSCTAAGAAAGLRRGAGRGHGPRSRRRACAAATLPAGRPAAARVGHRRGGPPLRRGLHRAGPGRHRRCPTWSAGSTSS